MKVVRELEQRMREALEEFPIPKEQLDILERYLVGEENEKALETIDFVDFSECQAPKTKALFSELYKKRKTEAMKIVFGVLFAMGQATIGQLISMYTVPNSAYDDAQYAAITANTNSMGIRHVLPAAKHNAEALRSALCYQQGKDGEYAKLTLATAFFYVKYIDKVIGNKTDEDTELLFEVGDARKYIELEKEDEALLTWFEERMLEETRDLFANQLAETELLQVIDAIEKNAVTDKILQIVSTCKEVAEVKLDKLVVYAYITYLLSDKMRNIVTICLAWQRDKVLYRINIETSCLAMRLSVRGGNFDKTFHIDSKYYISWAVKEHHTSIWKKLLENNRECYLEIMHEMDEHEYAARKMRDVIKKHDPVLYHELWEEKTKNGKFKEDTIEKWVQKFNHKDIAKSYLRGETQVNSLLVYDQEVDKCLSEYEYSMDEVLREYCEHYKDEELIGRIEVLELYAGLEYAIETYKNSSGAVEIEGVEKLFSYFEREKVDIAHQYRGLSRIGAVYVDNQENMEKLAKGATNSFLKHIQTDRKEVLKAFKTKGAFSRYFGLYILSHSVEQNKKEILGYAKDKTKAVREKLLSILYKQKNWKEDIEKMLESKNATESDLASKVLQYWQDEVNPEEKTLSIEELVKELHKGGRKRKLAWAYKTPFSEVHTLNGEVTSEEYLQAILLCYESVDGCGVSRNAASLAENLDKAELATYVNELFDKWMEAGAEAKKRWVLYAASIHGGADIVQKLHHQIQEWPHHARGAIAAEAVQALALNPLPQSLLIVDGIARKFKFKQVKVAAGKALEFAASQLGLTTEELADKIVPDLGFNENMERSFDYGERSFKVTITPALEIEVFDEAGKKLKNMPAPGKKETEAKAMEAYNEFKLMKKQMKTSISNQKARLEFALSTEREWAVEAWKALFVKNPIMHQFAIGLIWGIYEDKKLVRSFRYMEDGSFNTVDEEECEIPDNVKIGLVHPIELSDEEKEAWKQQLVDYEITQPIVQLDREIFYMTEEEAECKHFERFGGCILNGLSLGGKLLGLGWYKGSVQDAGIFYTYYREDAELGLGVELHFSGSCVEFSYGDDEVTVYDARFFKAGSIVRGSYCYDEADEKRAYLLKDIPARYFSEIVLQLAKATATSIKRDEDWKKEAY